MVKPVCVPCGRFYRPHHNGFPFIEGMPNGTGESMDETPRGHEAGAYWKPYKLWMGDLWRCEGCGHELVVGTPSQPISENYLPNFDDMCHEVKIRYGRGRPLIQINDC